jgi:hypothetical protein
MPISVRIVKRLFAVSGNRCAFPGCKIPLVDPVSGKVTGRICHIKAHSPGGPRYDPLQTDEERHGYANLLLMCPIHHDVIDTDVDSYTVERLQTIKAQHEAQHADGSEPSDQVVEKILINSNTIIDGSILFVQNQIGGQVAHSITNVDNVVPITYGYKKVMRIGLGSWHLSSNDLQNIIFSMSVIVIVSWLILEALGITIGKIIPILLLPLLFIYNISNKVYKLKFARVGDLNLGIDETEKLYFTEITGICPFCDSEVALKNMPPGSDLKVMGFCTWNSDMHTFSFDHTTFTGVYYPIVWRKVKK